MNEVQEYEKERAIENDEKLNLANTLTDLHNSNLCLIQTAL